MVVPPICSLFRYSVIGRFEPVVSGRTGQEQALNASAQPRAVQGQPAKIDASTSSKGCSDGKLH